MKHLLRLALVVAIALSFASIRATPPAFANAIVALTGPPVDVESILPLTGGSASLGQSAKQAYDVFQNYINANGGVRGRPLRIVYNDDSSNAQITVQLINELAARGVKVILGPDSSAQCHAVEPLVETRGPVTFCLSPAIVPPKGSYMFTGYMAPLDTLAAMLHFFRDRGWTKIALLHTIDATGQEHDTAMDKLLQQPENRTLKVVIEEHFAPGDVSATAQVARIRASGAQALIVSAIGTAFGTAFRAITDAGLDIPVSATSSIMLHPAMREYRAILPKQLYFASGCWTAYDSMRKGPVKDQLRHYVDAFQAAGVKLDNGPNLSWDPALIVVNSLRALGPDASSAQIRDYIENLHGFAGINGIYDFGIGDQRGGLGVKDVCISQWIPSRETWVVAK